MSQLVWQFFFLWWILSFESAISQSSAFSGCRDKCGNVRIPYPFGIGRGCFLEDAFSVECHTPDKPLIWGNSLQALNISLDGHIRVTLKPAYTCFNSTSNETQQSEIELQFSQFSVSATMNKLIGVTCGGYVTLSDPRIFGNRVVCGTQGYTLMEGSCNGYGCCQASVPASMTGIRLSTTVPSPFPDCGNFRKMCTYGFLVEDDEYKLKLSDFEPSRRQREYTVVLDWWVGKNRCSEARKDPDSYACKSKNSDCFDAKNGPGYLCNCSVGYEGNPFISDGCQDINECEDPKKNICLKHQYCLNLKGTFKCQEPEWATILVGTIIGLLVMFLGICWMYWAVRQRRITKIRERFFERNGGFLLQQQLSRLEISGQQTRVFTAEELKKATENYHDGRILGQGGQGTVYKGILPNNRVVAIKKAKIGECSSVEDFINELIVLSQINHRNVVKLLGCCVETEVPLLVYEFVNNGTLSDHIHVHSSSSVVLSWETRLKIAIETAGAVSYLHSEASIPIIHRDIKSANILLDYNYTAKVSDFGTSRLIPMDQEQLTTLVRGTLGYMDPEYFHTHHLNEKSDVYSFGVVLLELLSGKRPLSFSKAESERYVVPNFLSAMQENRLTEILDKKILKDGNFEQMQQVAGLAMQCVRYKGDERPTMKEVVGELQGLRVLQQHKQTMNVGAESIQLQTQNHVFWEIADRGRR